jgi:hypothetical protein
MTRPLTLPKGSFSPRDRLIHDRAARYALSGKVGFVGVGGSPPGNPGETGVEDRWRQSHMRLRISLLSHNSGSMKLDPRGRRVSDGTWTGRRLLGVRVAAPAAMLHRTNMVSCPELTRRSPLSRSARGWVRRWAPLPRTGSRQRSGLHRGTNLARGSGREPAPGRLSRGSRRVSGEGEGDRVASLYLLRAAPTALSCLPPAPPERRPGAAPDTRPSRIPYSAVRDVRGRCTTHPQKAPEFGTRVHGLAARSGIAGRHRPNCVLLQCNMYTSSVPFTKALGTE